MAERGATMMAKKLPGVKWVESQSTSTTSGGAIYCDHEALSFSGPDSIHQVIDVREYAQDIPSFTTE